MKTLRFALLLSLPLVLLACSPPSALAQSSVQKPCAGSKSLAGYQPAPGHSETRVVA